MRWLGFLALALVMAAGPARAAEQVDIPQTDTTLRGVLFRPEGSGPFHGVVALHGCESLLNRSGKIVAHFAEWGEWLAAAGLAVIFPDSFGSRGLRAQCRVTERKVRSERERCNQHAEEQYDQYDAHDRKSEESFNHSGDRNRL